MSDLFDDFYEMGQRSTSRPQEPHKQLIPVTVRLNPEILCHLDTFASHAGLTRQALSNKLIQSSLKTAIQAFFEGAPEDQDLFEEAVYRCLSEKGIQQ